MASKTKQVRLLTTSLVLGVAVFAFMPVAYGATTSDSKLTQTINAGVLSTDIRNSGGTVVGSPSFAMSARTVSTSQQTSTGTFGDNNQRITVDNPGGANGGWTLVLNAKVPGTSEWTGGGNTYKYNGTAAQGQLTVNPTPGTLTATVGTTTGITKGSSSAFSGTTSITLLNAAAASDDILNVYLTGVSLSQTIPAASPSGSYSIDMTQTVTAT